MSIRIEVVSTETGFLQLKEEWNQLLGRSSHPSIFLTWEWLYTWWKYFGRGKKLHILAVREQSRKVRGIAPLFITQDRWGPSKLSVVKFLGTQPISSEYLDFIAEDNNFGQALEPTLNYLKSFSGADLLFFSDLLEDSTIKRFLSQSGQTDSRLEEGQTCPHIIFPSTWEEYLQSVNRRVKEYVKSNLRFFVQEKKGTLKKASESDYTRVLSGLFRLHARRWQARGQAGSFASPEKRDFHQEICQRLLETKRLGLYYLEVDKKIISVLYGFSYQDTYYYYQTGFDLSLESKRPGLLVLGYAIEDSFKAGLKKFDFLRGEEEYKLKWANRQTKTYNLLFPLTNKAKLALEVRDKYLHLKRRVKKLIRRST